MDVWELVGVAWRPCTLPDIQLELVLWHPDPHARTTLKHNGRGHFVGHIQVG